MFFLPSLALMTLSYLQEWYYNPSFQFVNRRGDGNASDTTMHSNMVCDTSFHTQS